MIQTASSKNPDTTAALAELAQSFANMSPTLVIVFFSARHSAQQVATLTQNTWPQAHHLGCSTSGEIISGEMTDGAMVAMAIDAATVPDVCLAVVNDMGDPAVLNAACQSLGNTLAADMDTHVGMVLMDGMSGKEEIFLDRLGDKTNLRFIGGSAGDDLAFQSTSVFADGMAYDHAAVLAILHVPASFRVIKTQSFCRTGKQLTPTQVNAARREVIEFNHQPASQAYMQAVGAGSLEEAASKFMSCPVGLMNGEEPYVRSPQVFVGHSLKFYCAVNADVELEVLQSTDIVSDTRHALAQTNADGKVAGILNFNCILRTLELKSLNKTHEYAALFTMPTIGFSTYGEADIGHINQTATMIALLK